MASGTIKAGFKDITNQFVWDSTVQQKQALQFGNLVIIRFQAARTSSTNAWIYATIPSSLGVADGRWTGIGISGNLTTYIRVYKLPASQDIRTESFPSNTGWIQGQILLTINTPAIT